MEDLLIVILQICVFIIQIIWFITKASSETKLKYFCIGYLTSVNGVNLIKIIAKNEVDVIVLNQIWVIYMLIFSILLCRYNEVSAEPVEISVVEGDKTKTRKFTVNTKKLNISIATCVSCGGRSYCGGIDENL